MNPRVASIIAATLLAIFGYPLLAARGPGDSGLGMMILIVFIGVIAIILAWNPRKRP